MYAPLQKFIVFKHLVMIGCYKLYVHIQRVQASFAHAEILGFLLGEPSMYIHGLGTRTERLRMSHIVDVMTILMLAFEATPTHVMIGLGVVDLVRVITKTM